MAPNEPMMKAYKGGEKRAGTVLLAWKTLNDKDLVALNAVLTKNNLKALSAPAQGMATTSLPK